MPPPTPRGARRTCCRAPKTSRRARSTFDGHPLVDTFHLEEQDDGRRRVWVALDARADAARYGFREGDALEAAPEGALVVRGDRRWPLVAVRAPPTTVWAARELVSDLLALDADRAVPNAPSLTVDVVACFA